MPTTKLKADVHYVRPRANVPGTKYVSGTTCVSVWVTTRACACTCVSCTSRKDTIRYVTLSLSFVKTHKDYERKST